MSHPSQSTRPHLNAAIERLRLLVQPKIESDAVVPAPANVQPVALERDDDGKNNDLKNIHWTPELIDGRLHQLTNGRWLRQWRRAGELEWRLPLIDEVDRTGVDRRLIATIVSPEALTRIEADVRAERAQLSAQQAHTPGVVVWSFQHLLLQRLQNAVLNSINDLSASTRSGQEWKIGDRVTYCREPYTIVNVTTLKISLASPTGGEVDVYRSNPDLAKVRSIS